jgi:hypothetical protein
MLEATRSQVFNHIMAIETFNHIMAVCATLWLKSQHWRTRKPQRMGHLHPYGTEGWLVDDAHDLSLEHLMLLKEVTDQGRLQYEHPLGLCLVAAGRGDTLP